MTNTPVKVPFVDLTFQHEPIQTLLDEAIMNVVRRGDFVCGRALVEFESAFAAACGVSSGIGVACGTDAIALGLQACGIRPGDEVILPANTFVATLIGVIRTGATPILVDCELQTALIDLDAAEKAITPKTKAIVPVHLYGQMVSPSKLLKLAQKYNLIIFEDAAQAHLAQREGYRPGAVGTAAAFSFYPSKNLGAFGDGGMVVTADETVAKKVRTLRNYGAPKKYLHTEYGTNSRLDTIQAAVLNVKLPHLEQWNNQRNQVAQQYDALLKPLKQYGIAPIQNQSGSGHVYHLYVIRILETCPLERDTIGAELDGMGILTGIHYPLPCHLQPAFEHLGYKIGDFPHAETLSQQILSLPMFPGLREIQADQVVEAICQVLKSAPKAAISA
ncbi:MAG TPA: erythromycin biosynthesis sensory transduction protein eryC1 [Cyanobacteria bacterium UBA11369]|nr:erythromycin biosynthesis sensory transduction protein eryC1 [Cyanobacteria bacterium UBA11371]HBE48694.1 erythromycin biosynthesis sensory transduction protein eryC1 [Cyanobacteria bacterium UBA11369]